MQTQKIIETIRWINALYEPDTKKFLLSGIYRGEIEKVSREALVKAMHDLILNSASLRSNRDAIEVINAFGLDALVDEGFMVEMNIALLSDSKAPYSREQYERLIAPFSLMVRCADPLNQLTMPEDIESLQKKQEILSLELKFSDDRRPALPVIGEVARRIQQLYDTLAFIAGSDVSNKLSVVKIESGSGVRFDLRGVAEIVMETKNLLLEAWNKIRYRRQDEILANNQVVLSSLAVIEKVREMQREEKLSNEDADRYCLGITENTAALFELGVLPAEIPALEEIDNRKLLENVSPRLLPAPAQSAQVTSPTPKPRRKRKSGPRSANDGS